MKKVTFKFLFALAFVGIFMSCKKKDNDVQPSGGSTNVEDPQKDKLVVKKFKVTQGEKVLHEYTFEYNDKKQMTAYEDFVNKRKGKIELDDKGRIKKDTYTVKARYDSEGVEVDVPTYYDHYYVDKGADPRATVDIYESILINDQGAIRALDKKRVQSVYLKGKPFSSIFVSIGAHSIFRWSEDGNLTKYDATKIGDYIYEFSDYDDKINPLFDNPGMRQKFLYQGLLGGQHFSKNNPKNESVNEGGEAPVKYTNTYEYNEKGYVTKRTRKGGDKADVVFEYTY